MKSDIDLQCLIDSYGNDGKWWYQPIQFKNNVMTHSKKYKDDLFYSMRTFGINKWNNYVVPFLPFNLKDKVVLDIGCNSGIFLIQAIRAGASFVYGIEPDVSNLGFYKQCLFVIDMFSEIDNFDYKSKIKVIKKKAHKIDWKKDFDKKINITLAYSVLYWASFNDENGSIDNPNEIINSIISGVFSISDYFIIMGDEFVQNIRKLKNQNSLCTSVETTLPFFNNYIIEKIWIEDRPLERSPSIIVAKKNIVNRKGNINIDKLIKYMMLMPINDEPIPTVSNKDMFPAYLKFCQRLFNNEIFDLYDSEYADFIKKWLLTRKNYRHFIQNDTKELFVKKLKQDADLAVDIKNNGLKVPISFCKGVEYNNGFFTLDGCHRTIIFKALNKQKIEFVCDEVLYRACFNRMKKHIVDLSIEDFSYEYKFDNV